MMQQVRQMIAQLQQLQKSQTLHPQQLAMFKQLAMLEQQGHVQPQQQAVLGQWQQYLLQYLRQQQQEQQHELQRQNEALVQQQRQRLEQGRAAQAMPAVSAKSSSLGLPGFQPLGHEHPNASVMPMRGPPFGFGKGAIDNGTMLGTSPHSFAMAGAVPPASHLSWTQSKDGDTWKDSWNGEESLPMLFGNQDSWVSEKQSSWPSLPSQVSPQWHGNDDGPGPPAGSPPQQWEQEDENDEDWRHWDKDYAYWNDEEEDEDDDDNEDWGANDNQAWQEETSWWAQAEDQQDEGQSFEEQAEDQEMTDEDWQIWKQEQWELWEKEQQDFLEELETQEAGAEAARAKRRNQFEEKQNKLRTEGKGKGTAKGKVAGKGKGVVAPTNTKVKPETKSAQVVVKCRRNHTLVDFIMPSLGGSCEKCHAHCKAGQHMMSC